MKWEIVPFAKKKKKKMRKTRDNWRFNRVEKKTFQTTTMGNGIRNKLKIDN